MTEFVKYPRTPHLQGSKLQDGDHDLDQVDVESLVSGTLVWEEKLDGANTAFSFTEAGDLQLQSRGHILRGGSREAQFAMFKAWAETHQAAFLKAVGHRYIVYGEWCFAKHTVFYDWLPHFFLEFDVYDRRTEKFLSTPARRKLLQGLPVVSVPVVHEGLPASRRGGQAAISSLIEPSLYKTAQWRTSLDMAARESGQDPAQVRNETDNSDLAEGLYLKHEHNGHVIGRYKFVRADFLQAIAASGTHWQERPILPNRLAPGVDLFAASPEA